MRPALEIQATHVPSKHLWYHVLCIGIYLRITFQDSVLKLERKSLETGALVARSKKNSCSNSWQ